MIYLTDRLKQIIVNKSTTKTNKKIAEYLLANKNKVLEMTITEMAIAADTSTAAIIRLCNILNLKGYSNLKIAIAEDLFSGKTLEPTYDLSKNPVLSEITNSVIVTTKDSIEKLYKTLDLDNLKSIIDKIEISNNIIIIGSGASGVVCKDLLQKFYRLGYHASYTEDNDMQIVSTCAANANDIIFAISYSGKHATTVKAAIEAKKNKATVIGITSKIFVNSKNSNKIIQQNNKVKNFDLNKTLTLSDVADYCLYVPLTEHFYREGATLSRINQLVIVDIIYEALIQRDYKKIKSQLEKNWAAIH